MRPRAPRNVPILALVLAVAACGSPGPREPAQHGRAVVVFAPDREPDAREAAAHLRAAGFRVTADREGPPVLQRSSVVVYRAARRDEDVLTPARDALEFLPRLEWLPTVHGGSPGTDVVLWLVSKDRDEASSP